MLDKVAEHLFHTGSFRQIQSGSKIAKSGRKPASIKEAALGRLPQTGRAAPRPAPFVGILMEAGVRPEFGILLPSI